MACASHTLISLHYHPHGCVCTAQRKDAGAPEAAALAAAQPPRPALPFPLAWAAAIPDLDGLHKPVGLVLASAFVLSASVQISSAPLSACVAERPCIRRVASVLVPAWTPKRCCSL